MSLGCRNEALAVRRNIYAISLITKTDNRTYDPGELTDAIFFSFVLSFFRSFENKSKDRARRAIQTVRKSYQTELYNPISDPDLGDPFHAKRRHGLIGREEPLPDRYR